jgi:tRNA1(Val) A37 N6-methylase TrmN6
MGAVGPTSDPGVAADLPWAELAQGKDAVVDVGGGQGTLCCSLADRYPDIKQFIVQDLPETREAAESFIKSKNLTHRVKFEAQDFFKPQQRNGKYLFVMQRGG